MVIRMPKKVCKNCGGDDFVPNGQRGSRCKPCKNSRSLKDYYDNRKVILKNQAAWYQENKDKVRDRQRVYEETDAYKDNKAKWAKDNREYKRFESTKRRASLRSRTPTWVDLKYVKLFYVMAKSEEERTGRAVEVDHIVPLQGKDVCGLHWEHNLQLLFKGDNRSKGNRYAA